MKRFGLVVIVLVTALGVAANPVLAQQSPVPPKKMKKITLKSNVLAQCQPGLNWCWGGSGFDFRFAVCCPSSARCCTVNPPFNLPACC